MEITEKIKKIAAKDAGKITPKEREFITGLAAEHSITINPLCKNCVHDAAVQLYILLTKKDEEPKEVGGYALIKGCNVLLNGEPVNEARLTKENARRWLEIGLPKYYFSKLPEE